jgi:hypothetical protein
MALVELSDMNNKFKQLKTLCDESRIMQQTYSTPCVVGN